MKIYKKANGFSLVEIMVVVVIIGLLAGIVGANVVVHVIDTRITTAKTQIKNFASALEIYKLKKGTYPKTLAMLAKKDRNGDCYINVIVDDPWENAYEYKRKKRQFEIISYGADGEDGGDGENEDIKYSEMHKKK